MSAGSILSRYCSPMNYEQFLVWNVRGLNNRARRTAVRDLVSLERVDVVCIQETKVAVFSVTMLNELLGPDFDYSFMPSARISGGVLIGWHRDHCRGSHQAVGVFSVTVKLTPIERATDDGCWLTSVYGPTDHWLKEAFLIELEGLAPSCAGAWLVCGDFNLIYQRKTRTMIGSTVVSCNAFAGRLMLCSWLSCISLVACTHGVMSGAIRRWRGLTGFSLLFHG